MGRPSGRTGVSAATRAALPIAVVAAVLLLTPAQGRGAVAGEPDPSFGTAGFTVFDEPNQKNEFLADLLVLPDGKILGAGSRGGGASGAPTGFLLARFNSDGTPDLGFGGEGFRVEPDLEQAGDPISIEAIEERGDGKFVVAGTGRGPTAGSFRLRVRALHAERRTRPRLWYERPDHRFEQRARRRQRNGPGPGWEDRRGRGLGDVRHGTEGRRGSRDRERGTGPLLQHRPSQWRPGDRHPRKRNRASVCGQGPGQRIHRHRGGRRTGGISGGSSTPKGTSSPGSEKAGSPSRTSVAPPFRRA